MSEPRDPGEARRSSAVVGAGDPVETLAGLVSAYLSRRPGMRAGEGVSLVDAEVMAPGRPGILDVVADAGDKMLHVPLGLRAPGDEARYLPESDDPVLGLFEDSEGVAVAIEAVRDAELASLLLRAVTGHGADPSLVRQIRMDQSSTTLAMDERLAFTVYSEISSGPRVELEMLTALDEVGFNHIAAPVAVWHRGGRDLGVVQEYLPGASVGWSLALTSVRDLYASGGPPELAGGDFGPEARRLGTMAGRMHVALEEAFGRMNADVSDWANAIDSAVRPIAAHILERPEIVDLITRVRSIEGPCYAIRTHGDFHLGRVYRTEQGWYVGDLVPGGRPVTKASVVPDGGTEKSGSTSVSVGAQEESPVFRSPLADVADMLWSFWHVSSSAAEERDPSGGDGLSELASAWEDRNCRAFLSGYTEVPGIDKVIPSDEEAVAALAVAFQLERSALGIADDRARRSR